MGRRRPSQNGVSPKSALFRAPVPENGEDYGPGSGFECPKRDEKSRTDAPAKRLICREKAADGIRTHDLLDAIEARSQLRHGPTKRQTNATLIASPRAHGQTGPGLPDGTSSKGQETRRLSQEVRIGSASIGVPYRRLIFLVCLEHSFWGGV